jgi:DNA-binding NarL/FixJ family response regulator
LIVDELGGKALPTYSDREFDKMIKTHQPDAVMVTTRDCFHDRYIVRAMELGCDAITEKPMTTDEKKCRRILDAQINRYPDPQANVLRERIRATFGIDARWDILLGNGSDMLLLICPEQGQTAG